MDNNFGLVFFLPFVRRLRLRRIVVEAQQKILDTLFPPPISLISSTQQINLLEIIVLAANMNR